MNAEVKSWRPRCTQAKLMVKDGSGKMSRDAASPSAFGMALARTQCHQQSQTRRSRVNDEWSMILVPISMLNWGHFEAINCIRVRDDSSSSLQCNVTCQHFVSEPLKQVYQCDSQVDMTTIHSSFRKSGINKKSKVKHFNAPRLQLTIKKWLKVKVSWKDSLIWRTKWKYMMRTMSWWKRRRKWNICKVKNVSVAVEHCKMQLTFLVKLYTLVVVSCCFFRSLDALCGCITCCRRYVPPLSPSSPSLSSTIRFPSATWYRPFYRLPSPYPLAFPPRHTQLPLLDRMRIRLPVPASMLPSPQVDNVEWMRHIRLTRLPKSRVFS